MWIAAHLKELACLLQIADGALAIPPTAFGALGALGIISAALFVADPEKRCATVPASCHQRPPCMHDEPCARGVLCSS